MNGIAWEFPFDFYTYSLKYATGLQKGDPVAEGNKEWVEHVTCRKGEIGIQIPPLSFLDFYILREYEFHFDYHCRDKHQP